MKGKIKVFMNIKKKIRFLAGIFVLVAVLVCITSISVGAADISVSTNDASASRGERVTFYATVAESTQVGAGAVELIYDTNVLELVSGTCNVEDAMLSIFDKKNGRGAFAFSTSGNVSGKLFTVTFKVKDTAVSGETSVLLKLSFEDASGNDVVVSNTSGTMTVKCAHVFDKEDTANLKEAATCQKPAEYWKSCSLCNEVSTTEYFTSGEKAEHTFTKEVTTDAYLKAPANCQAPAEYYKSCECGEKGTETFTVGEAEHIWSNKWSFDKNGHWHACEACGEKKDEAAHDMIYASVIETATCKVCEHQITVFIEHTHSFDSDWKSDGENHWKECACGEKNEAVAHKWNAGEVTTEPTEEAEGEKTFTCTECEAKKTESIAKLEKTETPENIEKKSGCKSNAAGAIALFISFICMPAGAFLRRRFF